MICNKRPLTTLSSDMMAEKFSKPILNTAQSRIRKVIQSQNREQGVRKRKVHFSTKPDKINRDKSSPLTMEEKQSTWYSVEETAQMKNQAKSMTQKIRLMLARKAMHTSPQYDLEMDQKVNNEVECPSIMEGSIDETRGLESYIFVRRRLEKEKAIRTILEEQKKMKISIAIAAKSYDTNLNELIKYSHERMATVSTGCSQWAKDVALATAKLDLEDTNEINNEPAPTKKIPMKSRTFSVQKRRFALATTKLNFDDFHESNIEPPQKKKCLMHKQSFPFKKRRFSNQVSVSC